MARHSHAALPPTHWVGAALVLCSTALGIATARPCAADVNVWTPIGAFHGPVIGVVVDPRRPGVIYASTYEQFFISIDDGISWTPADVGRGALSIAFDPIDSLTLYVATGEYGVGVYKSVDGGTTWSSSAPAGYLIVYAVAVDPERPQVVYAGTYRVSGSRATGVFKSVDGGQTWNHAGLNVNRIDAIAVANTQPPTLFAKADGTIFRSSDGDTWTRLDLRDRPGVWACDIAVDPVAASTVYLGTENAVLRSGDGGDSWTAFTAGLTAASPCALAIYGAVPSTSYVGTERGVFKSTDSGQRWAPIDPGTVLGQVHAVAVDPHSPGRLYVGSERGLFQLDQRELFHCGGDCNGDDRITIDELVTGVAIALGSRPLDDCPVFDADGDRMVSIDELTAALAATLESCLPASFSIDLHEFGGFEFRREHALGFCPPLGSVYDAQLLDGDEIGNIVFYHDTLEAGVPGVDHCDAEIPGDNCAVIRSHPMRTLGAAEAARVRDVFSHIEVQSRALPFCGAIDPCLLNSFRWDRMTLTDAPCSDRRVDATQSAAIIDLLDALHRGE
jgi:photosystem II stability/assembly factor-like uncharacterized protein